MVVNKILKFMVIFFPVIFFGIYGFMNMSSFSDILYVIFSMFTAWAFFIKK